MNQKDTLLEICQNLWRGVFREKLKDEMSNCVRYYRAQVTANPGNNTLTVQRAFDSPVTVRCAPYAADAAVGTQVVVAVFGQGMASNHVVVGTGTMNFPGLNRYSMAFTSANFTQSGTAYTISIPASAHECGTSIDVSVWELSGTTYRKYQGFPSNGWTVSVGTTTGDVTLTVPGASARFSGKIIITAV